MRYIKRRTIRFLTRVRSWARPSKGRKGQTLVEYALIIAVISIVAIGILLNLGQQLKGVYSMIINSQIAQAAAS